MKTKNALFSAFILLFSIAWTTPSFAKLTEQEERAALEKLLQSPDQPLVSEVFAAFGNEWPSLHEFYAYKTPHAALSDETLREMARTIAVAERMYPGATMMTLGRDAQVFGTWYEAFWVSVGQYDRRIQLKASGSSFKRSDFPTNARFMLDSGIELFDESKKYIIYDYTSYHDNAQSRSLLRAVYWQWIKEGRLPSELVKRFTVASFSTGNSFDGTSSKHKIGKFFEKQAEEVSSPQFTNESPPTPSEMIQLPRGTMPVSHGGEWHNGYGTLQEQKDGKVWGLPKARSGRSTRLNLLRTQLVLFRQISTPKFLQMVHEEAKKLGYKFPVPESTVPYLVEVGKPLKATPANLKKEFKDITSSFGQIYYNNREKSLSENGKAISAWLTMAFARANPVNSVVLTLLELFHEQTKVNKLSAADFKLLTGRTIAKADFTDRLFVKKFEAFLAKNPELRKAFLPEQLAFFEKAGVAAVKNFHWILQNIIKPHAWECEEGLMVQEDATGAA